MICQLCCVLFLTLTGTVQGMAMEKILKIKDNYITKKVRLISWTGLSLLTGSINVFVNNQFSTISLRNIIQYSISILLCHLFYTDKFWKKLTAIVLTIFAFSTSELLFLITFLFENIQLEMFMDFTTEATAFIIGIAALFSSISMQIVVFIWKKVFKEGQTMKYGMYFAIYFFYKLAGMVYLQMAIWENSNIHYYSINMLLAFVCILTLLVIIFSQAEKEQIERKLTTLKLIKKLEDNYYREISKKRNEIAQILKDNKNILINVKEQLDKVYIDNAAGELERLLKRVEETKEYPFCESPIINTVLTEKQKICEKKNIQLNINISTIETKTINHIDMCSIFANVLDNAIRATEKLETSEAVIDLLVRMSGKYLIIKCKNSTLKEPAEIPEGTGYGLKIIKGIAQRYDGDFRIKYEQNIYEVQVILDTTKEQEV